ncbi:MAG: ATP-binding protein [Myxococcota bacterium]
MSASFGLSSWGEGRAVTSRVEVLALAAEARGAALARGFGLKLAGELALCIAELGMNALRHGGGRGVVALTFRASGWSLEVSDAGPGFSPAVLADEGRSDRLGAAGVRAPGEGQSFGSGLAAVRRLASRLELTNPASGGARVVAHRELPMTPPFPPHRREEEHEQRHQ